MRAKYESEDSSAFKCCFCCHVRIGTVLLGLLHVVSHILVLGCLITSSLHPELLLQDSQQGTSGDTDGIFVIENQDGSTDDNSVLEIAYDTSNTLKTPIGRENLCFAFALVMCVFLISIMMVYGACRTRPSYLMPFFCLQVFDFCITCLSVVGYMTYAPDVKLWIIQQNLTEFPGMDRLLQMDEQWLMILFVLFFVLLLAGKAYLIQMVWACYKYLQLRLVNRSVVREYTLDPDSEMLLPPKYEEAIKQNPEGTPPPPYTA